MNGYIKYKKNAIAPAPLTSREEELQEIKKSEVHTDYNVDSKQQTLGGVSFPITASAKSAVEDMLNGLYDYLQFKIGLFTDKILGISKICSCFSIFRYGEWKNRY